MTKSIMTLTALLVLNAPAYGTDCSRPPEMTRNTGVSHCQNILFNNLESGNAASATVAVCSKVEHRFMTPSSTYSLETYFRVDNRNIVQGYVRRALRGETIDCDTEFARLNENQRSSWMTRDLVANSTSTSRMRVVSRNRETVTVTVLDLVPRQGQMVGEARTVTVPTRQPVRANTSGGIDLASATRMGDSMLRQVFAPGSLDTQMTRDSGASLVAQGTVESPGLQISRIRTLGVAGVAPASDVNAATGRQAVGPTRGGQSVTIRPMITSNVISGASATDNVIAAETRIQIAPGGRQLFSPGQLDQPNTFAGQTPAQMSGSVDSNGDLELRLETRGEIVQTLPRD